MRKWSITVKVAVSVCGIASILFIIGGAVLIFYERKMVDKIAEDYQWKIRHTMEERADKEKNLLKEKIELTSKILSQVSALHLFNFSPKDIYPTLHSFMEYPEILAIAFIDVKGKNFAAAWKTSDFNIEISDKLPDEIKLDGALKEVRDCMFEGASAGKFTLYFTQDILTENLKKAREGTLSDLERLQSDVRSNIDRVIFHQALGVCGILLTLLVLLIFVLRKLIINPLNNVSDAAHRLANYDLGVTVDSKREDDIGRLLYAVKNMVERLKEIISSALNTAIQMNESAEAISGAVTEQASVTSQQSASVTEISSTMEELSATSAQIAENSRSVVDIAAKTLHLSQEGTHAVGLVMEKMNRINADNQHNVEEITALRKKADEITKVMGIINTIADQTKLIAFNAAIEASSAGEAGRRFGVVASEIRRLADSVMESTGEIESRIIDIQETANQMVITSETSTKGIREGMESFSHTAGLLDEILAGAQGTTDAARQISLSTQQQKTATEQIVAALKDIAKGAEQTSSSIRNISSIAKNLTKLSADLQELMKMFKLKEGKME